MWQVCLELQRSLCICGERSTDTGRLRRMLRGDSIECAVISVEKTILDQWGTLFEGEGKIQFR